MKEFTDNIDEPYSGINHLNKQKDLGLVYLFWIKIIFGIIGGVIYYFILLLIFNLHVSSLFRGLLNVSILLIYILILQFAMISILCLLKFKPKKLISNDVEVWRFSLRFSFIYLVIFLISVTLTYYLGY
jgi:hypothetical protein